MSTEPAAKPINWWVTIPGKNLLRFLVSLMGNFPLSSVSLDVLLSGTPICRVQTGDVEETVGE